jgi:hypothetical protein
VRELPEQQCFAALCSESCFSQIPCGIDVVELLGLEQRVEGGRNFGAALGLGFVVVLTTDDGAADRAFRAVVVERPSPTGTA